MLWSHSWSTSSWTWPVCVKQSYAAVSPPCRKPRWWSWWRGVWGLSPWLLEMGPMMSAWSGVSLSFLSETQGYDSMFRNSSQASQSWDSNNDDKCGNVVRTAVGIICLKGWSTLCVLFSCSHRCWHQRSGGDAGRPGVRLRLGSVSVPAAALAGTRTVVLRPHVQLPVLFFLQELCLHVGALLVRLLLWFLSSGKDNGASHKVCMSFSFLCWAAQKQLLPWFNSVLFPQTVYDQWFITLFNIVYTSLPVLAMGLFDQVKWSNKAIFSHF